MDTNFPYTQSYKKIPEFFQAVQNAAIPDKVTQKVLGDTFGFKGTNDRTLIGVLKGLGFIDAAGVPTSKYSDYKIPSKAKIILGESIKNCYEALYQKNEKFHTLSEEEIKGLFASTTGKDAGNKALNQMIKTFLELRGLAVFDTVQKIEDVPMKQEPVSIPTSKGGKDFVLTHTIVLNLPASTDQKVYDTLFKSIKENLL
ncbi:DUF5343 domain-containing protein [Nitrosopumilus adriaticus]|uniref:DUF5343 domain-containing protein n=1 Tax=Nitrosopumilus adriaticus TaxID=1580092 RepID=UPI00352D6CD7